MHYTTPAVWHWPRGDPWGLRARMPTLRVRKLRARWTEWAENYLATLGNLGKAREHVATARFANRPDQERRLPLCCPNLPHPLLQ